MVDSSAMSMEDLILDFENHNMDMFDLSRKDMKKKDRIIFSKIVVIPCIFLRYSTPNLLMKNPSNQTYIQL